MAIAYHTLSLQHA